MCSCVRVEGIEHLGFPGLEGVGESGSRLDTAICVKVLMCSCVRVGGIEHLGFPGLEALRDIRSPNLNTLTQFK
jgi:hypothetical protein